MVDSAKLINRASFNARFNIESLKRFKCTTIRRFTNLIRDSSGNVRKWEQRKVSRIFIHSTTVYPFPINNLRVTRRRQYGIYSRRMLSITPFN